MACRKSNKSNILNNLFTLFAPLPLVRRGVLGCKTKILAIMKKRNQYYAVIASKSNYIVEIYNTKKLADELAEDHNRHDYHEHYKVVRGVDNIRRATKERYNKNYIINYGQIH